jgi:hypothetical protein
VLPARVHTYSIVAVGGNCLRYHTACVPDALTGADFLATLDVLTTLVCSSLQLMQYAVLDTVPAAVQHTVPVYSCANALCRTSSLMLWQLLQRLSKCTALQ